MKNKIKKIWLIFKRNLFIELKTNAQIKIYCDEYCIRQRYKQIALHVKD